MRFQFVLPLPRFVFHPLTAAVIAAIHVYLAYGHLAALTAGQGEWAHIGKGFAAEFSAEINIHFPAREALDKPTVLVFAKRSCVS